MIKQYFLCFIAFSVSGILFSQENENKIAFGAIAYPNFSKGFIYEEMESDFPIEHRKSLEKWKLSLSVGGFAEYSITANTRLGLGLGYQNNGERIKSELTWGSEIDPQLGFVNEDPNLPDKILIIQNRHNIETPIYLICNITSNFYFDIGFSGVFNFENTSESVFFQNNDLASISNVIDDQVEYKRANLSGNFGLGFTYYDGKAYELFFEPYFQMLAFGVAKEVSVNRRTASCGVRFGIKFDQIINPNNNREFSMCSQEY